MEQKIETALGIRPRAAIAATRQFDAVMVGTVFVIVLAGAIAAEAFDISSVLAWGVAGGIAGGSVFVIGELRARGDAQPGGWAATLAVTENEFLVIDRGLWLGQIKDVVAQVPLDSLEATFDTSGLKQSVTLQVPGDTWVWRSPKIRKLQAALTPPAVG